MIDLAWQQVRPQLGQLAVAIVAISLAVGLSCAMLLANDAIYDSFRASIDAMAGRADLRVTSASGGLIDGSVADRIGEVAGVEAVAPLLVRRLFLADGAATAVRLVGADMLDDSTVRTYGDGSGPKPLLPDPLEFLAQPDSVLAPASFLRRHGLSVGDRIGVMTPGGRLLLTVRGSLAGSGVPQAFGGSLLLMDLYSAQTALGLDDRVSQIDIKLSEAADREKVTRALKRALPPHYSVDGVDRVRGEAATASRAFRLMLDAIGAFGLVLAGLIAGNRLSTIYESRTWEMGVMRALGTSATALILGLLTEAAIISCVAVAIGLPLGILGAQLIVEPVANVSALNLKHAFAAGHAPVVASALILAAIAGVATGLLAALVPAVRAGTRPPATVLARSRLRDSRPRSSMARRARPVIAAVAVGLVLLHLWGWVGYLAAATMAMVVVAAWMLIEPAFAVLSYPLGSILGSAASIGVEDQGKVPSRAMGAAAVLMLGIAIVGWVGSMRESFASYVVDRLMSSRQGDLVVDSEFNRLATGDLQARISEDLISKLRTLPGVQEVGAAVAAKSLRPEMGVLAVDGARLENERFGRWRLRPGADEDALARVARGEAALIDENLSKTSSLSVGDRVRVNTPSRALELPVAGIVSTIPLSQNGDVILSRDLYRTLWKDSTVTQIYLLLQPGVSPNDVRRRILDDLGHKYRLRVMLPGEMSSWFDRNVRQGFAFFDALMALTLVVALFGSFDALAANVIERTREIGTMRALGLTRLDVGGMVLAQALTIGLVGATLGAVAGIGMTVAFVHGLIPAITGWNLGLYFQPGVTLTSALLGVGACILGSVIPAARAAAFHPAEALRTE